MSAFDVLSDALHELTRRNVSSAKGRSSTPTLGPVGQMSPKERVDHQKNVSVISRHKLPLLGHFRFRHGPFSSKEYLMITAINK